MTKLPLVSTYRQKMMIRALLHKIVSKWPVVVGKVSLSLVRKVIHEWMELLLTDFRKRYQMNM